MKKTRYALIIVILASTVIGHLVSRTAAVDESAFLWEVAPEVGFGQKGGSPPHYAPEGGKPGTIAFNTYDIVPSIRGYAGPIKTLVALSPKGVITGIRIIEHRETPNYVHQMETPEFLGKFLGKRVGDPFVPDEDIDGITRATVSVKALADSVRESSRAAAAGVFGIKTAGGGASGGYGIAWAACTALFALALAGYAFTRRSGAARRQKRMRDASLLSGIVVLGLWLSTPFSVLHVFNLLLLRVSSDMLWYAIIACIAVSLVLAGRLYCGWLCPFGAISEFLGRIDVKKWKVPEATDLRYRKSKYLVLGITAAVALSSGRPEFGAYETYLTLFSLSGSPFAWALVVISLLASLRVRRFWCRFLCPVGALSGMLSRGDPSYPGSADCPMSNAHMPHISECIRCNRCYTGASGG